MMGGREGRKDEGIPDALLLRRTQHSVALQEIKGGRNSEEHSKEGGKEGGRVCIMSLPGRSFLLASSVTPRMSVCPPQWINGQFGTDNPTHSGTAAPLVTPNFKFTLLQPVLLKVCNDKTLILFFCEHFTRCKFYIVKRLQFSYI